MAEEKVEKKKKGGAIKAILFLLIFFILIPGLALTGFYFLNETFQYRLNTALADAPLVGTYFDTLPTRQEKISQIKSIAEYFLEISADRAVDKLILIKADDKTMYDDIIKVMLQLDPNATNLVIESIREKEIRGDAVSTTLDEIVEERNQELSEIASDLESIPFASLRTEMYKIIDDGLNGYSRLARILEQMDAVKAFELLTLLDEEDSDAVLNAMDVQAKALIKEEMNKDMANQQKLISMSEIYASKDADELIDTLGNTSSYQVDELAIIFKEIGIVKTGQILSMVEDETLVNNVITEMKNNEVLSEGEDLITKDILKTLKIYKDFDDNISRIANISLTRQSQEVSNTLKRLLTNGSLPQVYVLDSGDIIEISDEMLAYEVLERFDDKTIAEIIGYFDDTLASEVYKKLTIPEY
jgi:hypothetical protein